MSDNVQLQRQNSALKRKIEELERLNGDQDIKRKSYVTRIQNIKDNITRKMPIPKKLKFLGKITLKNRNKQCYMCNIVFKKFFIEKILQKYINLILL